MGNDADKKRSDGIFGMEYMIFPFLHRSAVRSIKEQVNMREEKGGMHNEH